MMDVLPQAPTGGHTASSPALRSPPLSTNSTALKWETPVPDATRAAAAGLLAQLVQLPAWCAVASDRLATPRLVALLNSTMQKLSEAAGEHMGLTEGLQHLPSGYQNSVKTVS